ncbi:hypothetical protein T440DRAFT_254665 [Plenodomus tracheiphilus IPT5]|uniref:Uncharacterized protein n=1 Tax=Plenodomus tracheiphilus IPT5 TaxID=1408161 RepID=A0A6A7AUF6_9PLEO|nr:hypothetical protein T440DRAFT_254665 [Plenodomus tracheiphilus IPT5]
MMRAWVVQRVLLAGGSHGGGGGGDGLSCNGRRRVGWGEDRRCEGRAEGEQGDYGYCCTVQWRWMGEASIQDVLRRRLRPRICIAPTVPRCCCPAQTDPPVYIHRRYQTTPPSRQRRPSTTTWDADTAYLDRPGRGTCCLLPQMNLRDPMRSPPQRVTLSAQHVQHRTCTQTAHCPLRRQMHHRSTRRRASASRP